MKATKQYFPVLLFIMLYKAVLSLESVDEILKCDHSYVSYIEQYLQVMLLIMLYREILPLETVDEILN